MPPGGRPTHIVVCFIAGPRQQQREVALVVEAERGGQVGQASDSRLFAYPPLTGLVQMAQQQLQPPFGRSLFSQKCQSQSREVGK